MKKLLLGLILGSFISSNAFCNALHDAVRKGDLNLARVLLGHNVDPDERNEHGYTPLYYAIQGRDPHMVDLLLKNGADPSIGHEYGKTPLLSGKYPLFWAIEKKHIKILGLLLDNNANPNTLDEETGWYPLHFAAYCRNTTVTLLLSKRGANPNIQNSIGNTPQDIVAWYKSKDISKILRNAQQNRF